VLFNFLKLLSLISLGTLPVVITFRYHLFTGYILESLELVHFLFTFKLVLFRSLPGSGEACSKRAITYQIFPMKLLQMHCLSSFFISN